MTRYGDLTRMILMAVDEEAGQSRTPPETMDCFALVAYVPVLLTENLPNNGNCYYKGNQHENPPSRSLYPGGY